MGGDLGVAALCLLVYLLCGQRTLHGTDSENLVLWLKAGDRFAYPRHVAFLPLTCWLHSLLQPLGISAFRTLLLASACGSALGVFAIARAARWLLPANASPRSAALAVAVTPAWFFYATAVELPGVFVGGLGVSWWLFARWCARPGPWRAAAVGFAVGAAAGLHGLGSLLTPMFVLFALARGGTPWRRGLLHATLALSAQLGVTALLSWWLSRPGEGQAAGAISWLTAWMEVFAASELATVLWQELLVPYLPWCVVALVAACSANGRTWAKWWGIAFLLHAPVALLLLARPLQIDEHGAYLLPVAVPAALTAAAVLPRRWLLAMLLVSAVLAVLGVAPEWRVTYRDDYVAGIAELRRERPFTLLVGRFDEIEAVAIETDGQPLLDVNRALWEFLGQRAAGTGAPLSAWFDGAYALFAASGSPLFVTEGGRAAFTGSSDEEVRRLWSEHVERNYELLAERRAGLNGWFLRPRAR
ncbi:MAG: hypothetical protein R3F29_00080 [Planctomycetota bacterium]